MLLCITTKLILLLLVEKTIMVFFLLQQLRYFYLCLIGILYQCIIILHLPFNMTIYVFLYSLIDLATHMRKIIVLFFLMIFL